MSDTQAVRYSSAAQPSVLLALNRLSLRLEQMLMGLGDEANAERELRAIALKLVLTVGRSPDVALASIYLNQLTGLYSVRHCIEAGIVVSLVARAAGNAADDIVCIVATALTMNVGIVRLIEVLQMKDCALSAWERTAIQRHPSEGADLLRRAGVSDENWILGVLMHHELDDGSGYPEGRRASDISDNARLIGMADRYCALVSARNYRRSLVPPVALEKLCAGDGAPVNQILAAHFSAQVGMHPPGTLVRLRNGDLGVVSSRSDRHGFVQVHALRDAGGAAFPCAEKRSTRNPHHAIDEVLHEDEADLRFSMQQVWGERAGLIDPATLLAET